MRFRNDYWFLSNMYECSIDYKGHHFRNVEAAFQAQKDPSRTAEFENLSGKDAKRLGRKVNLRSDWERVKEDEMRGILRAKFSDPSLAEKLCAVDEPIEEENDWNDTYWGICNGRGRNRLGVLLEELKAELQPDKEEGRKISAPGFPEDGDDWDDYGW